MVEYTCETCGNTWSRKSVYQKHLQRKNPCKKKVNGENYGEIINKLNDVVCDLIKEKERMSNIIDEHDSIICKITKENKKMKKTMVNLRNDNKKMEDKINILDKIYLKKDDVHIDNIVMGNQNNINIIAFGYENWSFLTNEQKLKILDGGFKSVQRYVQLVHMNKEKPEYSNIYVKNWKDSKGGVMINDGNEWIRCKNEVIDDLRDRGIDFVDITHEYLKSKDLLPEHIDKKIERFTKELDGDNGEELRKKISSDIKLDLYNYGKKKAIK
jgi:hypothetical protein